MLGLSGNLSYAGSVYLCICVFVFVYLCMRHLGISVQMSSDLELSENVWFVWSKTSLSGIQGMVTTNQTTNRVNLEQVCLQNSELSRLLKLADLHHQICHHHPLPYHLSGLECDLVDFTLVIKDLKRPVLIDILIFIHKHF